MKSSTSDFVIRPPRPVPLIAPESTWCSRINRRTAGPARSRASFSPVDGAGVTSAVMSGPADASGVIAETAGASACGLAGSGAPASPSCVPETPAPAASPGSNSANTSPAVTVVPSVTRTSLRIPSLGAGTSSTTLSVSSSTSVSSLRTGSPDERRQFTSVASLTDSGSCGTLISIVTCRPSQTIL